MKRYKLLINSVVFTPKQFRDYSRDRYYIRTKCTCDVSTNCLEL